MRIEKDQIISGVVLVVLAAVFVFGAWMPMRSKKAALVARIDRLNQELGPQRAEIANLAGLVEQEQLLTNELEQATRYVPEDVQLAALLSDLNAQIDALGVQDAKIEQEDMIIGIDYQIIPLSLRLKGKFLPIFDFVRQIESMDRLVRINSLEIALERAPWTPDTLLRVDIQLDTFAAVPESEG